MRSIDIYQYIPVYIFLILLAACATPKATLVTGETILGMGDTFVQVAEAYNQLHDQGIVTDEEYRDWKKFGLQFQATYRPLVNLYTTYATGEVEDKAKEAQIAAMLSSLNQELVLYLLKARRE